MTKPDEVQTDLSLDMKPLVVLHDKRSRTWNPPAMYQSEDAARRDLAQAAKHGRDVSSGRVPLFVDYPEDFCLYIVGYYNTSSGVVFPTSSGMPILLCEAADVISKE